MGRKIYQVIIVLLTLSVVYLFYVIKENEKIIKQNEEAYNSEVVRYKDKLGRLVIENRSLIVSSKKLRDSIKNIKPTVVVRTETKIVIKDSIELVYVDSNKLFSFRDKFIQLDIKKLTGTLKLTNLTIFNQTQFVVGHKREHWYSQPYSVVQITDSNPYLTRNIKQNMIIRVEKKWYDKWYVHTFGGLIVGYLIFR